MLEDKQAALKNAISALTLLPEYIRAKMVDGQPGGLLDFTAIDKTFYVLGDLHGNIKNLKASLETDQLEDKLKSDNAYLLLLGDIVHEDRVGYLTEMGPSLKLLDYIVELVNKYPENVFIIRGNHDSFDPQLSKNGLKQGVMFYKYLVDQRGKQYAELVSEFFDVLPLVMMGRSFIAFHAGPIRGGATREHLTQIYRYEYDMWQIMWNRINLIGSEPNKKEYDWKDIAKTKELLMLDESTLFLVGHNPLLDRGGDDSIWFDVMGIKNYIIIYNALPHSCPILKLNNNSFQYILMYADLKIKKPRFVLGDY